MMKDATIHPYNNLEKIHELGPGSRGFRGSQECQSSQVSHKKYLLSIMLGWDACNGVLESHITG